MPKHEERCRPCTSEPAIPYVVAWADRILRRRETEVNGFGLVEVGWGRVGAVYLIQIGWPDGLVGLRAEYQILLAIRWHSMDNIVGSDLSRALGEEPQIVSLRALPVSNRSALLRQQ